MKIFCIDDLILGMSKIYRNAAFIISSSLLFVFRDGHHPIRGGCVGVRLILGVKEMSVVCELSVVPLGTKTASVSRYVADVLKILDKYPFKYELTAMGTIIEGELDDVLNAVKEAHNSVFSDEIVRVVTSLKIDERRDKTLSIQGKMKSVNSKL